MKENKFKIYAIAIAIPLLVAFLGGLATSSGMDTYAMLEKPIWTPPPVVFPLVWTILYVLMGFTSARIYLSDAPNRTTALALYGFQLVLNGIWSYLFFGMGWYFFSFVWIVVLWFAVFSMAREFYTIDPVSAFLQVPYLMWLTLAGFLNLAIWFLNR